ncbi:hypothetical protein [Reyranella sp. CPCC 100927]|uniref:hypothetical protein n=1 Tax=Reyranella sp. CPCC 100927 TaxID=2599616 RepID=UPI0011B73144|nr:hypothetical protein [Reyranella sp. CPCC 100927]TWS94683.1 hypothetical protein FQU96_40885 [Reyranella sp. CPCC 100927]
MTDPWPWLTLAGLGAFHGLNPAMGWLFAVALGLHRRDRRVVWLSPLPIALGHALSVVIVVLLLVWAGVMIPPRAVRIVAGVALIGWAIYHWRFGSRHRVRVGMRTGMAGLALWSFLMATAHGAGLMLWPVLMPLCFPAGAPAPGSTDPFVTALLGVGVHTLAMLSVTTAIAIAVYEWIGLAILRSAWINVDLIWTAALMAAGAWLLLG